MPTCTVPGRECNWDLRLYTEIFLGHPAKNRQKYIDGSPLYQVENVQKPVLVILHGLDDDVVPPEASQEWVDALRKAGKTFQYNYAGEPHGFLMRKTQLERVGR